MFYVSTDAVTVLKETVMHYNLKRSHVYSAMVNLSKAYNRMNISLLRFTGIIAYIDFIGKNTFVSTSYGGQLSDTWNLRMECDKEVYYLG